MDDPHLALAAVDEVCLGLAGIRQRRQLAAEVDQIAVAVFPVVEEGEALGDVVGTDAAPERHPREDIGQIGAAVHQ